MRNAEIADAFAELADRLALTDLKPYRYMAYRKADATFRELGESVEVLSTEGRLTELEGIGPAIDEKVAALVATGTFPALEEAREQVPDSLLALTRLPGVGPATAKKVHAATDGAPFDQLLQRAAAGTLHVGDGISAKVVDALVAEAARRAAGGAGQRAGELSGVPLDGAGVPMDGPWFRRDQADATHAALAELLAGTIDDLEPSGEFVRGCELVREVVVFGRAEDPAAQAQLAQAMLAQRGWEDAGEAQQAAEIEHASTMELVSPAGVPTRLMVAAAGDLASVRHALAGPARWVEREPQPTATSIPVELRDRVLAGLDRASIPVDLVRANDLKGELHAHSDWSDGRATILEMAHAVRARGDEYFCVTDHSAPYAMVGGLGPERLAEQAAEIAAVNEQLAREHVQEGASVFRVLQGSEVEILADGSLGLDDATLATLDWVVASIHTQQRQAPEVILARMQRVMANPLVDAIGHPTSRRLLLRDRTALDVDALIALAAEHDVVLEINANPDRLDLDSEHAARALAAGVRLTINTDAHRAESLALRSHGIALARRAAVPRTGVVNCLSADALLASRRRSR